MRFFTDPVWGENLLFREGKQADIQPAIKEGKKFSKFEHKEIIIKTHKIFIYSDYPERKTDWITWKNIHSFLKNMELNDRIRSAWDVPARGCIRYVIQNVCRNMDCVKMLCTKSTKRAA